MKRKKKNVSEGLVIAANCCGDHVSSDASRIIKIQYYIVRVGDGVHFCVEETATFFSMLNQEKKIWKTSEFLTALRSPTLV